MEELKFILLRYATLIIFGVLVAIAYHIKKEREYKKRSWRKKQHQRTLLDQSNAKRVVTSAVSFAQK